jgi:hemoglobin
MTKESFQTIYDRIGPEPFDRLISAFYRRVKEDPVLSALYPEDDMPGAQRRLTLFVTQLFGGPHEYEAERGHPRLRMRHTSFRIDATARDIWIKHMLASLEEAEIPEPARSTMQQYFERTATFLINTGGEWHNNFLELKPGPDG